MGNSPQAGHRLLSHEDYPCRTRVGKYAILEFGGRKIAPLDNDGEIMERWPLSLTVGSSSCQIVLTRTTGINNSDSLLEVALRDNTCGKVSDSIMLTVEKAKAGLLHPSFVAQYNDNQDKDDIALPVFSFTSNIMTTTNAIGGVTETTFHLADRESKEGLLVREERKRRKNEKPYMVNLWYYFAVRTGDLSKEDFGFSVAVKRIRVCNGRLEFDLESPQQHPSPDLFYMFDKVKRTQTWKPTYCPHCSDNFIVNLRNRGYWQSESEDSDGVSAQPSGRSCPNGGGGLLQNGGNFRGNNNGHVNVRKLILATRGR